MYQQNINEEEIDFRFLLNLLKRYKKSTIFIISIFIVSSIIHIYFIPNVYTSFATVEVSTSSAKPNTPQDTLSMIFNNKNLNLNTEIEIIKSRNLTSKALSKIDFSHRYYTNENIIEIELYRNIAFDINLTRGFNQEFFIYPYNKNSYRFYATGIDIDGIEWEINNIYSYGDKVNIRNFKFTLNLKKNYKLKYDNYRIVILDFERSITDAQGLLNISILGRNSNIIKISKSDTIALRAKEFVDALSEAYITYSVKKKTKEASKTLLFIDEELEKINRNLNNSAIKLENFKKDSNITTLDIKAQILNSRISQLEMQLSTINIEIGIINSFYKQVKLEKNLETLSTIGLYSSGGDNTLAELIRDLQRAVIRIKVLKLDYTDEYSKVKNTQKEITQIKKVIISMIKNIKKNFLERKKFIEQSIIKQQNIIDSLPENERIFATLYRIFTVNERIYSFLLEKRATLSMAKATTVSRNSILDKAISPLNLSRPKIILIISIALFAGIIFSIIIVVIRDILDDTIKSMDDIIDKTTLIELGVIPHIKIKDYKFLKILKFPKSSFSESFRNIRTNLQFILNNSNPKVITVTSLIGGEGKSLISLNLAGILSLTEKKVVIIDMNMRKPSIHKEFNLPNKEGISSILLGQSNIYNVIQHTKYKHLDIITSGTISSNHSELIQSNTIEKAINSLKNSYDFIILDTPPIGLITDTRLLINLSDSVIYIVRANYSKKYFLKDIDKLTKENKKTKFGILLNDMKVDINNYGYYEDN